MNNAEQTTYLDRDLSSAVLTVWKYINCECASENCAFDLLVRRVRWEEEERARQAYDRQEADRALIQTRSDD
jgi:hypothetical protein